MNAAHWLSEFQKTLTPYYSSGEAREITFRVLEAITNQNRIQLLAQNTTFSAKQNQTIVQYLQRLRQHEPVQYVMGYTYFDDLKITVSPAVLIPRPETAELVYLVYERIKQQINISILDCCTGSGCIALLIKKLIPESTVMGWDISLESLAIARQNAQQLQLSVDFSQVDLLSGMYPKTTVDVIISNPPYVPASEKHTIMPHVVDYEPNIALFSPETDPIIFYRYLILLAQEQLSPNGFVAIEHHYTQQETLINLFQENKFSSVLPFNDQFGEKRFIIASL